jgi:hypothetical protein
VLRLLRLGTIVAALLAAVVPVPAPLVEQWYSQRVYLAWQRLLTSLTNLVPIAVTDVLAGVAVVAIAAWGWRVRARLAGTGGRRRAVLLALEQAACAAAVVYLVFLASWGLNYRREPLSGRVDFDAARVTSESVARLARTVTARVNELYEPAHASAAVAWGSLPDALGPAFDRTQRQLGGAMPAVAGFPKWSLLTFYFAKAGVSGLTDPFALEVLVDWRQLPVERPFVAAHEWAHLAGYASESEANFIGWLVCLQGPPPAEYSGQLELLLYLLGAMPDADRAAVVHEIGPGPRRDLAEMRRRAAEGWPWLQRPAWWIYDRYLRANRVEEGVRSYGAALELMVGTRFVAAGVPALRPPPR